MENIIEIKSAAKRFKDKEIFKNINLQLEKGKAYGFVGHNGCGKSVLFKCICGFSLLSEGSITVNGQVIGKDVDFIRDAGVVIEHPEFINDLSGLKNLRIIADIQKKIDNADICAAMNQFNLLEDRDKKVGKYSLGMKQKLRLVQAIMEKPSILILDEPTGGLDKDSVADLHKVLKEFVANGGTLLMTSHHQQDIEELCDVVYEFDKGELSKVR